MNLFSGQQWRNRDQRYRSEIDQKQRQTEIEIRPMDTGTGEEGEGEMYGESNMEIYNTICKIDSQWKFAV